MRGVAELLRGAGEVGAGLGARRGEIPAASAGMTERRVRVWRKGERLAIDAEVVVVETEMIHL